jgi:NADH:ubiquinone oxidoreductase subunit H
VLGLLFSFLAGTCLAVYTVIIAGWSFNFGYSLLGSNLTLLGSGYQKPARDLPVPNVQ